MKNVLDIENATGTTVTSKAYEVAEEEMKKIFAEEDARRKKKEEMTRKIRLFTARFTRGLYFLMSLGFVAILTRFVYNREIIDTEYKFISFTVCVLLVGIFLFVTFILLVFLDTSKYEKKTEKSE